MFDNLLYQNASSVLSDDLRQNMLANSMLFSGPSCSGKLTAALELARILSCKGNGKVKGSWNCKCSSCLQHKALVSNDVLIAGPKDCILEIKASRNAFTKSLSGENFPSPATKYLFVRSVRKLLARFNPIFYENDDKASKISPYLKTINENLEEIENQDSISDKTKIEKICDTLINQCSELENKFMSDNVPVSHIRNASYWLQLSNVAGKKVLIIENAERMQESVRNALLKILEEPPANAIFILTTTRRGEIMPTILSRVRTYNFVLRTTSQQQTVIERVFHDNGDDVEQYLNSFLPISPDKIKEMSKSFLASLNRKENIDFEAIIKEAGDFKPRILFKMFLENLVLESRERLKTKKFETSNILFSEKQNFLLSSVNQCYEDVMVYNLSPLASLEKLAGELR